MTPRIALVCAGLALAGAVRAVASDLPEAAAQFREYYLGGVSRSPSVKMALRYAAILQPDGSWADIDYRNPDRSAWPCANHATRVAAMAAAAALPDTSAESVAILLPACDRAMQFWRAHDFQCPNWWFNEIGVPQTFGTYALVRGAALPRADFDYITRVVLARSGLRMTGENHVWLAGNVLMRAMLTGNDREAQAAAAAIWSEVRIGDVEGLQPDWSFHQHGAQQQFGNYGLGFASEISRWMTVLRGTSFALPPAQAGFFRNFLLEGENWVNWRGYMDLSACGRQIMPHSQRSKMGDLVHVMAEQEIADPANAARYAAFVARNVPGAPNDLVGYRYFWRSDYAVYRRPEFCATLKMSSARVIGGEMVNHENLAGRYLADGALLLYRRGDEYADIAPAWDWHHIPGTTTGWEPAPPATGVKNDRLLTSWVGGASDGREGCAALDYDRDEVRAHKAWFFHEDRVACLAAGISSEGDLPVQTTLNQSLLRGGIRVAAGGGDVAIVPPGEHAFNDADWVEHDGWHYTFFTPTAVVVASGRQTGNWGVVFRSATTPKADVSKDVFSLWIDHGFRPDDASAAWVAAPAGAGGEAPVLLANSPRLQAIRWSSADAQVAFWQPGSVEISPGAALAVDQPCLVLVAQRGFAWRVSVADPTQRLRRVAVSFAGRSREIELPAGAAAGSTVAVDW